MSKVDRTAQAEADLIEIFSYIAEDNPAGAEKVLRGIGATCDLIADTPAMGRERPELDGATRSFPVGNYVVFYRPAPDGILVLRVLHGARDIDDLFD